MSNPKVTFDITANDETGRVLDAVERKAAAQAKADEKRQEYLQRKEEHAEDRKMRLEDRSERKRDKVLKEREKIMTAFQKAEEKREGERLDRRAATGGGAIRSGFAASSRWLSGGGVSSIAQSGGSLQSAFAAASHESAGLAEKLGAAGVAGGVLTGAFVAAGLAVKGLTSAFVEGGASTGRTAAGIGVSNEELQTFEGAGERFGVDRDTSAGAMGNIASTLHDAKYGQNNVALAAMLKLGIGPHEDANGRADTMDFIRQLSDSLQRQTDPQTQAKIAGYFGATGALPFLRQGSGVLNNRMADVKRYGAVQTDADIERDMSMYEKQVQARQLLERGAMVGGRAGSGAYESVLDKAISMGRGTADGNVGSFFHEIANGATPALHAFTSALTEAAKSSFAWKIEHLGERSRQDQVSGAGAIGSMQMLPGTAREQARRMGIPFDDARFRKDRAYNEMLGGGYSDWLLHRYHGDEAVAAAAYNGGPGAADRWVKRWGAPWLGQISDADWISHIPGHGPHTYEETRNYAQRVAGPRQLTHRHKIEFANAPLGTKVTSRTDGSSGVSIARSSVGSGNGP